MRGVGAFYCMIAVVAAVSYLSAGEVDMHVDKWKEKVPQRSERCVTIELDNKRHRHILDHAWDAIDRGAPAKLHVDRDGADHNRDLSLNGIPTWGSLSYKRRLKVDKQHATTPHDRDEYPVAMSKEGGDGASVRYVVSQENQSAGREMGAQLRGYPDGQCFKYEDPPHGRER